MPETSRGAVVPESVSNTARTEPPWAVSGGPWTAALHAGGHGPRDRRGAPGDDDSVDSAARPRARASRHRLLRLLRGELFVRARPDSAIASGLGARDLRRRRPRGDRDRAARGGGGGSSLGVWSSLLLCGHHCYRGVA